MPKATLTFQLPEESEEFKVATIARSLASALWDVRQEIFRPARKHGYSEGKVHNLITKLDELARKDAGIEEGDCFTPYEGATELIGYLEELFTEILNNNEVAGDI